MNNFRGRRYRAEVHGHDRARGQRVGHAALEDDIHIHQPVAHNGIAERQWQEDKRQNREFRCQRGRSDRRE